MNNEQWELKLLITHIKDFCIYKTSMYYICIRIKNFHFGEKETCFRFRKQPGEKLNFGTENGKGFRPMAVFRPMQDSGTPPAYNLKYEYFKQTKNHKEYLNLLFKGL